MPDFISAPVIGVIILLVLIILIFSVGYVKAPPDMAFIISGFMKKSKIVIGRANIRIPFFERLDKLNLRLIWNVNSFLYNFYSTIFAKRYSTGDI